MGELFDFLYEKVEEDVENEKYKEPHPSCSHYSSLEEMSRDIFCPRCGIKNAIVSYPKMVHRTFYRASRFNPIKTKGEDKKQIMNDMVCKIYGSGGIYSDRRKLEVLDGTDVVSIGITSSCGERNDFVWFCDDYDGYEGMGRYFGLDKILTRDISKYEVCLVCYELDVYEITSKELEVAIDKVRLFERLGFKIGQLAISKFSHPLGRA